jgi:hypothetical protein
MADERTPPITPENLKEVLARLNDVLEEAARLRKDVIRQLSDQREGDRQYLNPPRKPNPASKPSLARKRKKPARKP